MLPIIIIDITNLADKKDNTDRTFSLPAILKEIKGNYLFTDIEIISTSTRV